jgi:pimeloyl-ACP methyl ester carboxylesterase
MAAYDAALAEWPVPYEELDVPTRLGTTHVIASGRPDAPPLMLLPSFAGSAVVWRLNVEALSRRFRTYAVDVIGQPGKSLAPRRVRHRRQFAGWFATCWTAWASSARRSSAARSAAVNQAVETPERVDRVVLISPAGTFASQWWKLTYAMRIRAPALRLWRRLAGSPKRPSLADLSPRVAPKDLKWAALIGTTMAVSAKVSVINPSVFSTRQLRAIRAPMLLLIGEQETLYAPAAMLALAKARMPQLQIALVPDADHIAAMAQPEDANARLLAFLGAANSR